MILVTSTRPGHGPAARAAVADLVGAAEGDRPSPTCVDPYANRLVSADGHSALVQVSR